MENGRFPYLMLKEIDRIYEQCANDVCKPLEDISRAFVEKNLAIWQTSLLGKLDSIAAVGANYYLRSYDGELYLIGPKREKNDAIYGIKEGIA